MPLNFPVKRKWALLAMVSFITLISPLASSMFAPAITYVDEDFNNSNTTLSALVVSIFVLGYAIGPLFISPLSEIYGRQIVFNVANWFFCAWTIACAVAPSLGSLIAFRLLAGIGGSGCLAIGGGVIADLFPPDQRGTASSLYSIGPLFGPIIGPLCGGFIAERAGWRWVFWVLTIAGILGSAGVQLLNRETNPRVLIDRKTQKLRKELDRPELRSCYEHQGGDRTKAQSLIHRMLSPLKMLFLSPIVFIMSLYMAFVYGIMYIFLTTLTTVFQDNYNWAPDITGLAYMGIGLGFFTGLAAVARLSDATVIRMTRANNGVSEPEMRLPACVFFAIFIPISMFWYGWTTEKRVQWMAPIIALVPFGFGMMGIFVPIQTYLMDAFPAFAASAVGALTASRSLFGALLPLAAPSLYEKLGLGWGNTLLGFLALALVPVPAIIFKYGEYVRKRYPIKL